MVKHCSIDLSNFFGKTTLIMCKINFNLYAYLEFINISLLVLVIVRQKCQDFSFRFLSPALSLILLFQLRVFERTVRYGKFLTAFSFQNNLCWKSFNTSVEF